MAQKTRPNPTQFRPLSVDQLNAIECLIAGHTDLEASAAVGVARTTISEWRHNPLFVATLNARRAELWEGPQARLLGLAMKAVENLTAAVESGHLKASVELLKAVGLYGLTPQIGSSDPHAIMAEMVEARVERQIPADIMPAFLESTASPERYRLKQEIQGELWKEYGVDDPMQ